MEGFCNLMVDASFTYQLHVHRDCVVTRWGRKRTERWRCLRMIDAFDLAPLRSLQLILQAWPINYVTPIGQLKTPCNLAH